MSALGAANYRVRSIEISKSSGPINNRRYGIDPHSEKGLESLVEYLRSQDGERSVSAVVSLLGLGSAPVTDNVTEQLFLLLQQLHCEFRSAEKESTLLLLNVLALDGRLGMTGALNIDEDRIGTVGLCKSIGREMSQLHTLSLDLSPELPVAAKLSAVFEAVLNPPDMKELGIDSEGRWTISLQAADLTSHQMAATPPCDSDSVIVVTGGGDGVTAYVSKQFASVRPTFVILGRTPLPEEADFPYLELDEKVLRTRLLQEADKSSLNLAAIERRVRRYQKQARIHQNLTALREQGAKVDYLLADVANTQEFEEAIDSIYQRHGRIDGVLHGAGVIRDKLLADKSLEAFRSVYSTKVDSARTLARKLRPEGLRFLVFFSSVASRFGNYGQCDYSAANEYLNKLSNHLNQTWPSRVVSIQWGPWDGGMVDDFLRGVFERHNIRLIPLEEGARKLGEELRLNSLPGGEVLISRSVDRISGMQATRA